MDAIQLEAMVRNDGIRHINFFNGRLLSGEDLSAEREANHSHTRLLGQAVGEGVACGLEVSRPQNSPPSDVQVEIKAGLAVNKDGQALCLACNQVVSLVRPLDPAKKADCVFSDCGPFAAGSTLTGDGYYLLTIAPASARDGLAPVSGLGNSPAACNSRFFTEGVQFRLLSVNVNAGTDVNLARNVVAYQCFGLPPLGPNDFLRAALGLSALPTYGFESLVPDLTKADVALALIQWERDSGVGFVDLWSVRRPLLAPSATAPWDYFTAGQRLSEAVAMFLQFEDHIAQMDGIRLDLSTIVAEENFVFLPPLGLIPVLGAGSPRGFSPARFFGAHASEDVALLDATELRALMAESLHQEPMRFRETGKLQLYLVWESVRAAETSGGSQLIMAFAAPTLPYRGTARFGYARWNLSRRTFSVF